MASALAVGGLSSGIDTRTIVDTLIYADRATARLAEARKATTQARLDVVKAMNTKLLTLRDAMDAIEQQSAFAAKKVTSSNETAVTALVGSGAAAGSLLVNVKKLATASQVATASQASSAADLGAGTVVLRIGSGSDVTISPTTNTMAGLAEAINAANAGVNATVINDGSTTPYRLVVTSSKTGAANAITKLDGTGGFAGVVAGLASPSTTVVTNGADAEVRLGDPATGLLLKSASNTMDQAIAGVTLNLKSIADGITITTGQDAEGVRDTVQKMLDAYNDARSYYTSNSKFNVETKISGPLFADYELRGQLDAIENALTQSFGTQASGYQRLSDLGITAGSDGTYSINAAIFDAKLADDQNAVASLFLSSGSAGSVPLEGLTRSVDGAMALKQTGLEQSISAYTERIAAIDARLEIRRAFYEAQFLQMEKITAQMQSQGNALTNFVSGLSKPSSK